METTETVGQKIIRLIKTVVLARHGKAVKVNPADPDEARQLNELGLQQAIKLGHKLDPYSFDLVLSSPLPRARMTMAIATCGHCVIHDVPELTCDTGSGSPIDTMWTALGNVPIVEYFKHPLGNELKTWAEIALHALLENLSRLAHGRGLQTVLVGGHALLQPALALTVCKEMKNAGEGYDVRQATDYILNTSLNEGEAFKLSLVQNPHHENVAFEHIKLD